MNSWDDGLPSGWHYQTAPDPHDVAVSVAHKSLLLVAIVALIVALWAVTSSPAATGTGTDDATLNVPIGSPEDGQHAVSRASVRG